MATKDKYVVSFNSDTSDSEEDESSSESSSESEESESSSSSSPESPVSKNAPSVPNTDKAKKDIILNGPAKITCPAEDTEVSFCLSLDNTGNAESAANYVNAAQSAGKEPASKAVHSLEITSDKECSLVINGLEESGSDTAESFTFSLAADKINKRDESVESLGASTRTSAESSDDQEVGGRKHAKESLKIAATPGDSASADSTGGIGETVSATHTGSPSRTKTDEINVAASTVVSAVDTTTSTSVSKTIEEHTVYKKPEAEERKISETRAKNLAAKSASSSSYESSSESTYTESDSEKAKEFSEMGEDKGEITASPREEIEKQKQDISEKVKPEAHVETAVPSDAEQQNSEITAAACNTDKITEENQETTAETPQQKHEPIFTSLGSTKENTEPSNTPESPANESTNKEIGLPKESNDLPTVKGTSLKTAEPKTTSIENNQTSLVTDDLIDLSPVTVTKENIEDPEKERKFPRSNNDKETASNETDGRTKYSKKFNDSSLPNENGPSIIDDDDVFGAVRVKTAPKPEITKDKERKFSFEDYEVKPRERKPKKKKVPTATLR